MMNQQVSSSGSPPPRQTPGAMLRWCGLLSVLLCWTLAWNVGCGRPGASEENSQEKPAVTDDATADKSADSGEPDKAGPDAPGPDKAGPDAPGPDKAGPDAPGPDAPGPDKAGPDAPGPDNAGPDGGEQTSPDLVAPDVTLPDNPAPTKCGTPAPAPAGKLCVVSGGTGKAMLIIANLLLPDKMQENGQLLIDATGKIACVGCNCKATAPADARILTCPNGVVSPGLINAHDHLGWALGTPKGHGTERYDHRHDWRKGKRGHTKISPGGSDTSAAATAYAEIRNMMAGTTSIVGSGGTDGFIRNLDRNREGIPGSMRYDTFPLGDSGGALSKSGCASYNIRKPSDVSSNDSYVPHVAEGIDAEARNEFACVSDTANGGQQLTISKSAFIHGVGLNAQDIALMAKQGTGLIWSPRTNIDLYGNTATIPLFMHYKVPIALGTDWPLSGSMNMLRELECVDYLNKRHFNGLFSDHQIVQLATSWAAKVTKTDKYIGSLAVGLLADVVIFDGTVNKSFRAVIAAQPQDVALVMRQGKPLYGNEALITAIVPAGTTCEKVDVCTNPKSICIKGENSKVADYASLISGLQSKNPYKMFFCGTPQNEPSCVPARPGEYGQSNANDKDGDGVEDSKDNCPDVFNAIRPLDGAVQADADKDGKGDVCDPCPLTANTTTCKGFDPNDRDGDGIPNATDNCPNKANPLQEDKDKDKIGDICDSCPDADTSGGKGCPTTILAMKTKKIPLGTKVALVDALVTARTADGTRVALQMTATDPGYVSAEYSGIIVYLGGSGTTVTPLPAFKPGDRLTINGTVQDFNGQIQLANVTALTVKAGTETVAPTVVKVTDVNKAGSPKGEAYEGVLVEVVGVEVTNKNPDGPTNDYGEFSVALATDKTNELRVDDQFDSSSYVGSRQCDWVNGVGKDADCYSPNKCQCPLTTCAAIGDGRCYPTGGAATADKRTVGDKFKNIRGILVYTFSNFKLTPRSAADLIQ